jgi:CRP-like cAMP-binding protein
VGQNLEAAILWGRTEAERSFSLQVDILTDGEAVNELCLVVDGSVEIITTTPAAADQQAEGSATPEPKSEPPVPAQAPSRILRQPHVSGSGWAGQEEVEAPSQDPSSGMLQEQERRRGLSLRTISLKRQLGASKDEVLHVRTVGPGCCFGEIAFFTEIPQHEVPPSCMSASSSSCCGVPSPVCLVGLLTCRPLYSLIPEPPRAVPCFFCLAC